MNSKQIVLVSGATRGLGFAIARRLLADGFAVVATGRKPSPALTELCEAGDVCYESLDLADHAALHDFTLRIAKSYGPLYGLVNNGALGHDGVLATMHDSHIEELVAVNLTGTILLTKYALRPMLLQRRGRIVNISSIIATTGFSGLSVYAATKSALNGFTRSLSREVGKVGITVNTIAPGYMQTDMSAALTGDKLDAVTRRSPLRRLATVEDVAGMVSWLLGPDASSVTGATFTVDAGSTA